MFDDYSEIPEIIEPADNNLKKKSACSKNTKLLKKINKNLKKLAKRDSEFKKNNEIDKKCKTKETNAKQPNLLHKLGDGIVKVVPAILKAVVPMFFAFIFKEKPTRWQSKAVAL